MNKEGDNKMNYQYKDGELYHYGVLGMKWGVRKNRAKAYEKASKKLSKLDVKVDKTRDTMYKRIAKADRKRISVFATKSGVNRADYKAKRAQAKYISRVQKAHAWYRAMEQVFRGTDISMTTEQQEAGKRYVDALTIRSNTRDQTIGEVWRE